MPTTVAPTSVAATATPTTTATTVVPTTVPTTAPPTTVAPTTTTPTSVAATASPTTVLTTLAPTTFATQFPFDPDHDNDVTFNCLANNGAGVLRAVFSISGRSRDTVFVVPDGALSVVIGISGNTPASSLFTVPDGALSMRINIGGWGVANDEKKNWVGWSKIGEANFTLDRTNDAGFRPMSWNGYVYQVKKLGKGVVIYGSGGVTLAMPVAEPHPTFGFKDLYFTGVKNKTAVGGDEFTHYFIDDLGALFKVTEQGLEYMGFEEFLLPLTYPVLLYDPADHRLYISDATTGGYVLREDVLTGGHTGLSGLYRIKNVLTAIGPDTIEVDPVYIVTDVIDFKRRGMKHIEEMQFGVSADMTLYAAIDYRYDKGEVFKTTRWVRLNKEGVAKIPCTAVEFKVRLKADVLGSFDISYIKFQHKYVDQRFTRDPRENPLDAY